MQGAERGRACKVWVVSELYYPEDTSTGYFLTEIAEGLVPRFAVSVLCGQPTYASRGTRVAWKELRNGVTILRCRALIRDKNSLIGKLITHLTLTVSMFVSGVRHFRRGDAVLVVTNPPLLPFVVVVACKLRRSKCVLLVHDVYPEVLLAAGLLSRTSALVPVFNLMNRWLLKSVEHVVVLGRDMKQLLREKHTHVACDRVTIVPHWGDVDGIRPSARQDSQILLRMGLDRKIVVQYSGNIGRTHQVEALIECARELQSERAIHFVICGEGAKAEWVRNEVASARLTNVTILPRYPRERLWELLNACDIALICFVPGMAGISVPSRLYNIMAAGKPIVALCDSESEVSEVIHEEGIGWVVPPDQPSGLTQILLEAMADPERLARMGKRAREAATRKYTREHTIIQYGEVVSRVLAGS